MIHQKIRIAIFSIALGLLASLQSCYYDNLEDLYPNTQPCDTINVSFSEDVWPVISSNCTGCHSGGAPSGNVSLEDYNDIVTAANNGSLLGTIKHLDGWSPMPKGGGKLPDCDIQQIETWINAGTPNN